MPGHYKRQYSDRKRGGKEPIELDKQQFEKLCEIQCTEEEIAAWFGVSIPALLNWCKRHYWDDEGNPMTFKEVFEEKRKRGFVSMRRKNFQLLQQGSVPMAIFYSKNYLGMSDNPSGNDDNVTVNVNITTNDEEEENDEWDTDDEWDDDDEWN